MTTKQLSDTNTVVRKYSQADLNLYTTSGVNALSNVQTTKLKAGVNGELVVMAKSSGSCVIKLKYSDTAVIDFSSGATDITVNTNAWGIMEINGDTKKYWGLKVADPSLLTDLVVLETSELADGESISIVQAGFNAKNVAASGDYLTAFS